MEWGRRDSNPLSFLCTGFTVQRPSTIRAASPSFLIQIYKLYFKFQKNFVPSGESNQPISDTYSYTLSRAIYFHLMSNPPVRSSYSHQYTVINRHLLWNREELNLSLRIFSPTNITNYSTVPFVGADGLEPPTSCVSDRYSNQAELRTHKFFSNRKYFLLPSHIWTFDVISGSMLC